MSTIIEQVLQLVQEIHADVRALKVEAETKPKPRANTLTRRILERMRDGRVHTAYSLWEDLD